jgi:hypothetical protein
MDSMRSGNSFPQICVVSVHNFVENVLFPQEYGRSAAIGNRPCLQTDNGLAGFVERRGPLLNK